MCTTVHFHCRLELSNSFLLPTIICSPRAVNAVYVSTHRTPSLSALSGAADADRIQQLPLPRHRSRSTVPLVSVGRCERIGPSGVSPLSQRLSDRRTCGSCAEGAEVN